MLRRDVLAGLMALAARPGVAGSPSAGPQVAEEPPLQLGAPRPFQPSDVAAMAETLAAAPFRPPHKVPAAWTDLTYDQYRTLRFDVKKALWRDDPSRPLQLDVFAPGLYFPHPIGLSILDGDQARDVRFDLGVFDRSDRLPDLPIDDTLGYSGLRLRAELEQPGKYREFAVFQGASYFRAIGTGDIYGLSARGLAIDTAEPSGEEFPDFRHFWLQQPEPGETNFIVYALMDSPSCAGAYRFQITPGTPLVMSVEATVFPRQVMSHVGIAPLTSMFQFDETNRDRFSDFRPAVHDSDGLLIVNGNGESIWRPLANPRHLQISAFVDENPQGFGLMQRARRFSDFADLEALYHRRPGLWVEPGEPWGKGAVTLVEIPTDREIYDNIVCYWRPEASLRPGQPHQMSYRLTWGPNSDYGAGLRVLNTRIGDAFEDGIIVAVDFEAGDTVPEDLSNIERYVRASAGEVSTGVVQLNPETGGPRLAFKFHPMGATLIEFRAELRLDGAPLTETFLYRWTA